MLQKRDDSEIIERIEEIFDNSERNKSIDNTTRSKRDSDELIDEIFDSANDNK